MTLNEIRCELTEIIVDIIAVKQDYRAKTENIDIDLENLQVRTKRLRSEIERGIDCGHYVTN